MNVYKNFVEKDAARVKEFLLKIMQIIYNNVLENVQIIYYKFNNERASCIIGLLKSSQIRETGGAAGHEVTRYR